MNVMSVNIKKMLAKKVSISHFIIYLRLSFKNLGPYPDLIIIE